MSGKVVGWAFEQKTGSQAAKLVLVKLADNANESGYCFPSIDLIVEHTELSERAVRKHLNELQTKGLIKIIRRFTDGVQLPNHYHLLLHDSSGGMHEVQGGAESGASPVMHEKHTEPSKTNPQENPHSKSKAKGEIPDWIPEENWNAFVEMRKAIKKPLTPYAAQRIVAKLDALRAAGHEPGAVLDQSTVACWQGVFEIRPQSQPSFFQQPTAKVFSLKEIMESGRKKA